MLAPLVIFAGAALAAASCFALSFLSENSHLVPDLSPVADLLSDGLARLLTLASRPEVAAPAAVAVALTPVAVAASLPAVYFCAASGRWRDRETKRFAKAPAAR